VKVVRVSQQNERVTKTCKLGFLFPDFELTKIASEQGNCGVDAIEASERHATDKGCLMSETVATRSDDNTGNVDSTV